MGMYAHRNIPSYINLNTKHCAINIAALTTMIIMIIMMMIIIIVIIIIWVLVSVIADFWATIPNPRRPRVADSGIPYRYIG